MLGQELELTQWAAWIWLPFVLPICFYTAWTDLSRMKITNQAVLLLGGLFLVLGPIALPLDDYLWRLVQLGAVLGIGIGLTAIRAVGAGDAKFVAAAAPFIAPGDIGVVVIIYASTLLGAVAAHRLAKLTPIRAAAPDWQSWERGKDFPMGLALGGTLAAYLLIGAYAGA